MCRNTIESQLCDFNKSFFAKCAADRGIAINTIETLNSSANASWTDYLDALCTRLKAQARSGVYLLVLSVLLTLQ